MVEAITKKYLGSRRLLFMLSGLMAGGIISQTLGCLMGYLVIEDSQAAGMVAHLLIQQVSYYLLGCTFVILSLSNILIKRGLVELKDIRTPSLVLILCVAFTSFLLIPRMDYLREVALQDGMPVMLSPFANYFAILNALTFSLLVVQMILGTLVAWRMSKTNHPK